MTDMVEMSREVKVANCGAPKIQGPNLKVWSQDGFVEVDFSSSSPCAMISLEDLDLEPGVEGSVLCKVACPRFRKDMVATTGGQNG